jgi:hypothetical protein
MSVAPLAKLCPRPTPITPTRIFFSAMTILLYAAMRYLHFASGRGNPFLSLRGFIQNTKTQRLEGTKRIVTFGK